MWLRDFLPEDFTSGQAGLGLRSVRVMTFGYNVKLYSKAASERSSTFAEDLLSALQDYRLRDAVSDPVMLILYSLHKLTA